MIQAPEPLTAEHSGRRRAAPKRLELPLGGANEVSLGLSLGSFASGVPSLDDWLRRRALPNQASGASRCFVVCDAGLVIAYYALAASAVAPDAAPGRFKRNMPDPIPVVVLARLAIDRAHQGRGLGRTLFQDAANRVVHAADAIGIRGMLVHAISDEAKAFYLRVGLNPSPLEPMMLMATVADLKAALA